MGDEIEMRPAFTSASHGHDDVGVLVADALVRLLFFRVLVDEHDRRAELDRIARKLRNVDHLGAGDEIFQLVHAAFIEALRFLGGMILRVFGQVAMGARFRNRFDDARTLFLLTPAQFFLQLDEPTFRRFVIARGTTQKDGPAALANEPSQFLLMII